MFEEMPKRIEMIFQDAFDNLRFFKQQQWIITSYALTAYAALFALGLALDNGRKHMDRRGRAVGPVCRNEGRGAIAPHVQDRLLGKKIV